MPLEAESLKALVLMKALYAHYQHMHWVAGGINSYADHLLFERLYKGIQDPIDRLAERILASYEPEVLMGIEVEAAKYAGPPTLAHALGLEKLLGVHIRQAWKIAQAEGVVEAEAFFSALAEQREEAVYLLRRRYTGQTLTNPLR